MYFCGPFLLLKNWSYWKNKGLVHLPVSGELVNCATPLMVQVVPGVVVQLMFVTLQGVLELKGPAGIKIRFEFALLCTAPPIATIATIAEKRIFFIFVYILDFAYSFLQVFGTP